MDYPYSNAVKDSVRETVEKMITCCADREAMNQYYRNTYPYFVQSAARAFKANDVIELCNILNKLMLMTRQVKGDGWIDLAEAEAIVVLMGECFNLCTKDKESQ